MTNTPLPPCPPSPIINPQADHDEADDLLDQLGIDVLPTVQFWRNGRKLWEHRGAMQLEQGLGEGEETQVVRNKCAMVV